MSHCYRCDSLGLLTCECPQHTPEPIRRRKCRGQLRAEAERDLYKGLLEEACKHLKAWEDGYLEVFMSEEESKEDFNLNDGFLNNPEIKKLLGEK